MDDSMESMYFLLQELNSLEESITMHMQKSTSMAGGPLNAALQLWLNSILLTFHCDNNQEQVTPRQKTLSELG